jgi:hypothetical protein
MIELAPLSGDGYQSWVAALDPNTNQPRALRLVDEDVRAAQLATLTPAYAITTRGLWPAGSDSYRAAAGRGLTTRKLLLQRTLSGGPGRPVLATSRVRPS